MPVESGPMVLKTPKQIRDELFSKDYMDLDEFDYNTLGVQMMPIKQAYANGYVDPSTDYYNQDRNLLQNLKSNSKVPILNGRLFSRSVWEEMQGKPRQYQFPSEEIENERLDNEYKRMQQHQELKDKDPQKLGLALMLAGAAPYAPAMYAAMGPVLASPIVKGITTAASVAYGVNEGANAIESISKGNYGDAAAHGVLAATTAAGPLVSNLSKWPKLAAMLGLGTADVAAYARTVEGDWNQTENDINNHIKDLQYIPDDAQVQKIIDYLDAMGYQLDLREELLSDNTVSQSYDISSKDEEVGEYGFSDFMDEPIAQVGAYHLFRNGVPKIYNRVVNKKAIIDWPKVREKAPRRVRRFIRKHPGIKNYIKKGGWALDIPFWTYEGYRQGKRWGWWGNGDNSEDEYLTKEQKATVANAIRLLNRRYPDISLEGISPELQTGARFMPGKDTTDYIEGPSFIDQYLTQPQQNNYTGVDSATIVDAPDEY